MQTHLRFYYWFLIYKLLTAEKLLHVKCAYIYTCTHVYAAEAVSCSKSRLAGGHDEQQEILVKNARLPAVV